MWPQAKTRENIQNSNLKFHLTKLFPGCCNSSYKMNILHNISETKIIKQESDDKRELLRGWIFNKSLCRAGQWKMLILRYFDLRRRGQQIYTVVGVVQI